MEYIKLKVTSKDDAKRFYRTIAISGDPDLYTLGALIGTTVNAWFEHFYMFYNKEHQFVPDMWVEDAFDDGSLPMSKYHLSDLGEKFKFVYDTGEDYEFNCKVMKTKAKRPYPDDEEPFAFVVDGKGAGIFENDHFTLWRYLHGEIDPNSNEEKEDYDGVRQYLPMNMDFETYGDFDKPLDLDEMYYYEEEFCYITDHFKQYNDDDENDEDNMEETRTFFNNVAGDIFQVQYVNDTFRELIKTYDINQAFEMIVDATLHALSECQGNFTHFDEVRKNNLDKLIKRFN